MAAAAIPPVSGERAHRSAPAQRDDDFEPTSLRRASAQRSLALYSVCLLPLSPHQEFQVDDIVADSYDVFTLLYYLNAKGAHDGVRDFLVHRLYKVEEEEIERVLPQLTHLFMIWSPERSGPLGDFFSHLASGSIHLTLRLIWTFRALQFHCPNRAQVECMERCVLNMEMSLINASVLENDGQMRQRRKGSGARKEKRAQARREADEAEARAAEEERQMLMQQQGVDPVSAASASENSVFSSRESSRDPSPGRRLNTAAAAAGANPTSTTSRSRSLTPKGRRANYLPPPPSFVSAVSVGGNTSAGSAPTNASPLGQVDSSASPPGLLFRPDSGTPIEGAEYADQKSPSASSSSSSSSAVEFNETTKPASAPGASSSLVTHSTSFTILSTSPSPPTPTGAAAAAAAAASTSEAGSAPSSAASSATTSPSNASVTLAAPISPASAAAAAASADSTDQPTELIQSPGSYACSPAHASLLDELFLVYSKHVRSEYFNSIQRLMEGFSRISSSLVKLPVGPLRNKKLRSSMRDLDASARGLYFPTDTPGNKHYRILRFLPAETFVLNSRDKAPFLFHFEVQYSPSNSYDDDLYKSWRTHEEILAEAIKLAQCAKCEARNRRALEQAQGKVVRESRLAHKTDAPPPPHANSNPNPVATIQAAQSQMHSESNASSAEAHTSLLAPGAELHAPGDLQQLASLSLQHADSSSSSSSSSSLPAPLPTPSPPLDAAHHGPRETASSGRLVHTMSVPEEMASMGAGDSAAAAVAVAPSANVQVRAPSPMLESSGAGRAHAADYSNASSSSLTLADALKHRAADGPATAAAAASAAAPAPAAAGGSNSKRPSLSGHADWVLIPAAVPRPVALQNAFEQLSLQAFGESFSSRRRRIQASSMYYRTLPNTDVVSLIYKHGDDVRQEVMAMQFIRLAARIFAEASLPLYLHTYCILINSPNSGLIETVKDSMSVDSLKKNVSATPHGATLASFFHYYFSMQGPEAHERALRNFIQSMAAYSVVSYLLQIKDRHNGNLMLSVVCCRCVWRTAVIRSGAEEREKARPRCQGSHAPSCPVSCRSVCLLFLVQFHEWPSVAHRFRFSSEQQSRRQFELRGCAVQAHTGDDRNHGRTGQ